MLSKYLEFAEYSLIQSLLFIIRALDTYVCVPSFLPYSENLRNATGLVSATLNFPTGWKPLKDAWIEDNITVIVVFLILKNTPYSTVD